MDLGTIVKLVELTTTLIKDKAQNPEAFNKALRSWPVVLVGTGTSFLAVAFATVSTPEIGAAQPKTFFRYLMQDYRKQMVRDFVDINVNHSLSIEINPLQRLALAMIQHYASKEVLATSSTLEWWNDKFGKEYEQANIQVADNKGVRVTRIFLYQDDSEKAALLEHLKTQKQHHINVKIAKMMGPWQADLIVVDDEYAGKLKLALDRSVVDAVYYFDRRHVQQIRDEINAIPAVEFTN